MSVNRGDEPLVLGVDVGTEGSRAGVFDLRGRLLTFARRPHPASFPRPGWAEQSAEDWWSSLQGAVRDALALDGARADRVIALSVSATGSTPLLAHADGTPLTAAILWMDVRAETQARRLAATGDPVLELSAGTVSPEWLFPKALWFAEERPDAYRSADVLCESVDWLAHRLTGRWVANRSLASLRGYFRSSAGGWPIGLLDAIGFADVLEKLPTVGDHVGTVLGELTCASAEALGLPSGLPVATAPADAEAALVGLDVVSTGRAGLITGSSHLLLALVDERVHEEGLFGPFEDALTAEGLLLEGGQTSSGSITRWWKDVCNGSSFGPTQPDDAVYAQLIEQASALPPGADGVRALDFWQGNRTPYVDGRARGMLWGLSLGHGPEHIYRAILEAICLGTENILRRVDAHVDRGEELPICGGAARNPLWLQIHADVSGLTFVVPEVLEAVTLGNAILAATAAGSYDSLTTASAAMVRQAHRVEPDPARHGLYARLFDQYVESYHQMRALMHKEQA